MAKTSGSPVSIPPEAGFSALSCRFSTRRTWVQVRCAPRTVWMRCSPQPQPPPRAEDDQEHDGRRYSGAPLRVRRQQTEQQLYLQMIVGGHGRTSPLAKRGASLREYEGVKALVGQPSQTLATLAVIRKSTGMGRGQPEYHRADERDQAAHRARAASASARLSRMR